LGYAVAEQTVKLSVSTRKALSAMKGRKSEGSNPSEPF
jgi:hypothetical protein